MQRLPYPQQKPLLLLLRRHAYFIYLFIVEISWLMFMLINNSWHLFQHYWAVTVTMVFGSIVAGATAEGGAFVAFPVFTKILHISSQKSATFGLMIQSIGMSAATLVILVCRIPVLFAVIRWAILGGCIGLLLGLKVLHIPDNYSRVMFTALVTSFAIALAINRWFFNKEPKNTIANWNKNHRLLFLIIGLAGGIISASTGTGINILTFIVLTLAFGINEKIAVPTSVIAMTIASIFGFGFHFVNNSIGMVWNYWIMAVPVVVLGAALGAYLAYKMPRDFLIWLLLLLIFIEFITTFIIMTFTFSLALFFCGTIIASCVVYYFFLRHQHRLNTNLYNLKIGKGNHGT